MIAGRGPRPAESGQPLRDHRHPLVHGEEEPGAGSQNEQCVSRLGHYHSSIVSGTFCVSNQAASWLERLGCAALHHRDAAAGRFFVIARRFMSIAYCALPRGLHAAPPWSTRAFRIGSWRWPDQLVLSGPLIWMRAGPRPVFPPRKETPSSTRCGRSRNPWKRQPPHPPGIGFRRPPRPGIRPVTPWSTPPRF